MKTFEIEVTEVLQTIRKIQANSFEEALTKVKTKYNNEEIVLTGNEYVNVEITPYLYSKNYSKVITNNKFKEFILKNAEEMINEMSAEELIKLSFGDIENAISCFSLASSDIKMAS